MAAGLAAYLARGAGVAAVPIWAAACLACGAALVVTSLRDRLDRVTAGAARENVRTAQSLACLLLGDIREIAYSMKQGRATDLVEGLSRLAQIVPSPIVHVDVTAELRRGEPRGAHALLRCAQEFVTNSIRHAGARNVWIAVSSGAAGFELTARDNGIGVRELRAGGGLSGMHERLEELGGTLTVEAGTGFALRATVPA